MATQGASPDTFVFPTDPAGAAAAVEAACAALGSHVPTDRAAGERILLALRSCDNAVMIAQAVLQVTRAPDAAFQAASALRAAASRDSARLGHHLPELRAWCVAAVLRSRPALHPVVAAQLNALHGALLKRAWLTATDYATRGAWLDELTAPVTSVLHGSGDSASATAGLDALTAVVTEFCPATASALHLSWAQHVSGAQSFASLALRRIFELACTCGVQCTSAAGAQQPGAGLSDMQHAVAAPAVRLATACLSWDWSGAAAPGSAGPGAVHSSHHSVVRTEAPPWCSPPAQWQAMLVGSACAPTAWLAPMLRQHGGGARDSALALLLQMCTLRGPTLDEHPTARTHHIGACCACIAAALSPADGATLRLVAQCLLALSTFHPSHTWPHEGMLLVRNVSLAALACDAQAFNTCVEALATLHRQAAGRNGRGASSATATTTPNNSAASELVATCRDVFFAACERTMTVAASGDNGVGAEDYDDDGGASDGDMDTAGADDVWRHALDDLGVLARADVGATAPRVAAAMAHTLSRLTAHNAAGDADFVALEHMTWFVRVTAAILADDPDGECPVPPDECCAASKAAANDAACPVTGLARQLLDVLARCASNQAACSPRLAEAACVATARWANTWLGCPAVADTDSAGGCLAVRVWGMSSPQGEAAMQCCTAFGAWCLCNWPGEVALANMAARHLLPSLSSRKPCAILVLRTPGWQALCTAAAAVAAANVDPMSGNCPPPPRVPGSVQAAVAALSTLPPKTHRHLTRALACGVTGVADTPAAASYLLQLLGPHTQVVAAAAGSPPTWLARNNGEYTLLVALEALRGGAQATAPKTRECSLQLLAQAAPGCSALAVSPAVTDGRPHLRLACLRLAAAILESQLPYASQEQAAQLLHFGLDVVTAGAAVSAAAQLCGQGGDDEERQHESAKAAKAMLSILSQVASRDMCALAPTSPDEGDAEAGAVAAALLRGLTALAPVVGPLAAGQYPSLGRALVGVLSHAACVHPGAVCGLPDQPFGCVTSPLLGGVDSADPGVWGPATEGLEALCRHAVSSGSSGNNAQVARLVTSCQEALLSRLVSHPGAPTDGVADALLPALLGAPQHWMQLHSHLEQRFGGDASAVGALRDAVAALTSANGVAPVLDRHNARKFRANVAAFAATVRGLVRVQ